MELIYPVCHSVCGPVSPYQPELRQHDLSNWYWLQNENLYQINIYKRSLVIKSKSQEISCYPGTFRRFWCAVGVGVENILAFFYGRDSIPGQARDKGFRVIGYHNPRPLEEQGECAHINSSWEKRLIS
jgi:hypothetical protein